MIKAINKSYCIENLVQFAPYTDSCHLIVSNEEILLLKDHDWVLLNKYQNHPNRDKFLNHEKEQNDWGHFTELFKYNQLYLSFRGSKKGIQIQKYYFFKGKNRALFLEETLPITQRDSKEKSLELNRHEIEEIFDWHRYDSMYVIDRKGKILLAKNNKDGLQIGKKMIPDDHEIEKMELNHRITNYDIARMIHPEKVHQVEDFEKAHAPKTINEIKNFQIYGPALFTPDMYSHLVLTAKNGKFHLKWFQIDLIYKDRFRLTTCPIEILEPTVDDVLNDVRKYDIQDIPEQYLSSKSFREFYSEKNQVMTTHSVNLEEKGLRMEWKKKH